MDQERDINDREPVLGKEFAKPSSSGKETMHLPAPFPADECCCLQAGSPADVRLCWIDVHPVRGGMLIYPSHYPIAAAGGMR